MLLCVGVTIAGLKSQVRDRVIVCLSLNVSSFAHNYNYRCVVNGSNAMATI